MSQLPFRKSIAVVVGIDHYQQGISPLKTATTDALALASLLKEKHDYQVELLLNEQATKKALMNLLTGKYAQNLLENDRVLFYFAGHGVTADSEEGPAGYLVLHDGCSERVETFLQMHDLYEALMGLPCRHGLVILDSCFSGAFRWSSAMRRSFVQSKSTLYKERFDRFVTDSSWQLITSTSYDQTALDVLKDHRGIGVTGKHSPFAEALLSGLQGEADLSGSKDKGRVIGDGVITAQELATYLRDHVEPLVIQQRTHRQTPELWPLKRHDKGQYIFLVPGHKLNLPSAEILTDSTNPYRGLQPYNEKQRDLFFGRTALTEKLAEVVRQNNLTVVLGHSGTGKSSLVKAGLLPKLRQDVRQDYCILPPFRPGSSPIKTLATSLLSATVSAVQAQSSDDAICEALIAEPKQLRKWLNEWCRQNPKRQLLIVIDQFEELITLCSEQQREQFLTLLSPLVFAKCTRVVLTLRSDFESQFSEADLQSFQDVRKAWIDSRFFVSPMMQDELRQAIEEPASQKVMYFEPHSLVDQIINEVVQMPGTLPLLSFTLSELYRKYLQSGRDNRAMTLADYTALGGVTGALTKRATEEYKQLCEEDEAFAQTVKQVMLRMVSLRGGELARRRVPLSELVYRDDGESDRAKRAIKRFAIARLIVRGQEEGNEPYVEPAHDALVGGWKLLQVWKNDESENLALRRLLTPAATEWDGEKVEKRSHGLLWNDNPRLPLLREQLRTSGTWLNQLETKFVEKSEKRRKNERRRTVSFLSIVIAILSGLSFVAVRTANAERLASQDASARRLRAEAELEKNRPDGSLTLAMLLGLEAQKRWPETSEKSPAVELGNIFEASSLIAPTLTKMNHGESENLNQVENLVLSHDETWVASAGWDNTVRVWDVASGEELFRGLHNGFVRDVAFNPDQKRIVSISDDKTIRIWDIASGRQLIEIPHNSKSVRLNVMYSSDGRYIASNGETNSIVLLNADDGTKIKEVSLQGEVNNIVSSRNGRYIAASSRDGQLCILKISALNAEKCTDYGESIQSIDFSPNENTIALSTKEGSVAIWDFEKNQKVFENKNASNVLIVKFSPDGSRLGSAQEDGTISIWNVEAGTETAEMPAGNTVRELQFTPDSKYIVSMDLNKIQGWNISTQTEVLRTTQSKSYTPASFVLTTDAQRMISGHFNGEILVQDVNENLGGTNTKQYYQAIKHNFDVKNAILSKNGQYLATVSANLESREEFVQVWNLSSNEKIFEINFNKTVNEIYISDAGGKIAINLLEGSNDRSFEVWDVRNQNKLSSVDSSVNSFTNVAFSQDESTIAFSDLGVTDATFKLINFDSGVAFERKYEDLIQDIEFNADSSLVGVATLGGKIHLIETNSGNEHREIFFPDFTQHIDFSKNGKWLAASYARDFNDGSVVIWNVRGEEKSDFSKFPQKLESPGADIKFGSEDKWLAIGWANGSVDIRKTDGWDARLTNEDNAYQSIDYEDPIETTSVSEDGQWVINRTSKGVIYLMNSSTGKVMGRQQATGHYSDTAFSEFGPIYIDIKGDVVTVASLLKNDSAELCNRLDRNLTIDEWFAYFEEDEPYPVTCPNLPLPEVPTSD